MKRTLTASLLATAAIAAAGCGDDSSSASSDSASTTPTPTATANASSSSSSSSSSSTAAVTSSATAAAKAFLATLSDDQRSSVQHDLSDATLQSSWSNLPTSFVQRNGVRIADLNDTQVAALAKLLKVALGKAGYDTEEQIRIADQYLAENGGGSNDYGKGLYYVALYGSPSTADRWVFQFGGHHFAVHVSFDGATVSGTPYFIGVEPTGFTYASKSYSPMKAKSEAMVAIMQSLSSSQRAAAKLDQSFDDVVVGPGKDGAFPEQAGLTVSELSAAQKKLVLAAIREWVQGVNEATADRLMAAYEDGLDTTTVAWATSTDPTQQGAYFRIDGPRVWIEIVSQGGIVVKGKVHFHSIWRDRSTDYGG